MFGTRAGHRNWEVVSRTLGTQSAAWQSLRNGPAMFTVLQCPESCSVSLEGAQQQARDASSSAAAEDAVENSPSLRPKRLEGKVVLINGGGSGIGAATAKLFGLHGSKLVVADIKEELGRQVVEEIGTSRASFLKCDATQEDQIAAAVDLAVSRFGGLDVLVNVVGGVVGTAQKVQDVDVEWFDKTVALNLKSSVLAVKHAARVMIPKKRGAIVCFASCAGVIAVPTAGVSYSVSKFAVNGLAKIASCDLGQYGIRVNSIATSGVATERMLQGVRGVTQRDVSMEELNVALESYTNYKGTLATIDVAEAALFLSSDESGYISGHTLVVDGGFTTKKEWDLSGVIKHL